MNRCMSTCAKGLCQFIVDITKWRMRTVNICLFRLVKITFSLMFTGNVRFFATGRLQVTRLNNELSQGVGPITTNWNRVPWEKNPSSQPRSRGNSSNQITHHLPWLWRSNCEFLKSFWRAIVLCAGTTKSLSSTAKTPASNVVLITKNNQEWL